MSGWWIKLKLRTRLMVFTVSLILILTAVFCLLVLDRVRSAQEAEVQKRGAALAEQLGLQAEFPMRTGDKNTLDNLAKSVILLEDVVSIGFHAADGSMLSRTGRDTSPSCPITSHSYTVRRTGADFQDEMDLMVGGAAEKAGEAVGRVTVELSMASSERIIREISLVVLAAAVVLAGLAILVSAQFARRITGPIRDLTDGVEMIGEGRLDVQIEVEDDGEIGTLARHFNRMAQNLKSSLDQMIQQQKMASLGRMASGITHEIGSPLNAILLEARMLLDELPEGESREGAENIIDQTVKMKDIVSNLLSYARTPPSKMQDVDLNRAWDEAEKVLAHPLRKSNIKIVKDFPEELPKVRAIINLATQVFVNIISNAIQAAGQDGVIEAAALEDKRNQTVKVTITDSGPGVAEEIMGSIFDPFFTTRPEGEGTGLGLAISFQIMKGFHGDIRAERTEDSGAVFILEFQRVGEETTG
jgi:signal transduction histidine kinase